MTRWIRTTAVLWMVVLSSLGSFHGNEPVLLAEEARGLIVVEGQTGIEIEGLFGTLSVRAGRPGDIRFMARTLDEAREELPVAVWQVGKVFKLLPVEGSEETGALLELAVSPGVAVTLVAADSRITLQGIRGDVAIQGAGLELNVRALTGDAEFELSESRLSIDGLEGALLIRGDGIEATARRVGGGAVVDMQNGGLGIAELRGGFEADLENTVFRGEKLRGNIRAEVTGAEFRVTDFKGDGEFWMSDAALVVEKTTGKIQVDTDEAVQFAQVTDLTVRHSRFGSSIRGTGSKGVVDLEINGAEVTLADLAGPTKVRGSELTLDLKNLTAEIDIETRSSTIQIEKSAGGIKLENDFGNVTIHDVSDTVTVTNEHGEIKISQLKGQARVRGDGESVEVRWSAVGTEGDSLVENANGDVRISLPAGAGCRIDAEARYGHIEADHEDIRVTADGNFASGVLGRRNQPLIELRSGADLYVTTPGRANPNRPEGLPRRGKRAE